MSTVVTNKMQKPLLRSENPDPIDIHVGARLRMRRNLVGLSQEQLGKALDLTFQQIQKYERGINRMGASRLFQIAQLLSVPVAYFFEGLTFRPGATPQQGFAGGGQSPLEGAPAAAAEDQVIMHRRETLELVRAYYRIHDPKQRRKVYELIRAMSEEERG